jgi:hypothetical protein
VLADLMRTIVRASVDLDLVDVAISFSSAPRPSWAQSRTRRDMTDDRS